MVRQKELNEAIENIKWTEEEFDDELSESNYMDAIEKVDDLLYVNKLDKSDIVMYMALNYKVYELSKLQFAACMLHIGAEDYLPYEFIEILKEENLFY